MTRSLAPRLAWLAAAFSLVAASGTLAQETPDCLYDSEAEIVLPALDGYVRMPIDPALIARLSPDLAGIRLVDELHRDVEFAWVVPARVEASGSSTPPVSPREAHRARSAGTPATYVETFDLQLPEVPVPEGGWTLAIDVPAETFSATLTLSPTVPGASALTHTVFRMRDGSEQTRFAIPAELGNVVRVELRGQDGFLSPSFRFLPGPPTTPLEVLERPLDASAARRAHASPTILFLTGDTVLRKGRLRLVFGGVRARNPAAPPFADLRDAPIETAATTTHGAIVPNRARCEPPLLASMRRAGAEVDPREYRYRASVAIPASPEGIVHIRLPSSLVGASRVGLADVRLVDASGRQWPYLVVQGENRRPLAVRSQRMPSHPRESVFLVTRMTGAIGNTTLLVDPHVRLVDRSVVVEDVTDPGEPLRLSSTRLLRTPADPDAPIEIPLVPSEGVRLRVTVTDGDDAPLAPSFAIPFADRWLVTLAPAGRYTLLFGAHPTRTDVTAPSYELEQARELLLSVREMEVRPMRPEANPESAPPSAFSRHRAADVALFAVLGLAALVLAALTLRLSRNP